MTSSSSSSSNFAAIRDLPQPLHHLLHLSLLSTSVENLPTSRHFLAAAISSAVASGMFNPLDCLRVRWQTQMNVYPAVTTTTILTNHKSIVAFGRHIIAQEGLWQGLWKPGLGVNMVGMGVASGLRFGSYETMRNSFDGTKQTWHMLVAGLISGASAYWITTPFHLMKTRIQAEGAANHRIKPNSNPGVWQGVYRIVAKTGNLSSLFKGSGPLALRGGLFTAGQMLGYDGVKTMVKAEGYYEDGPMLHALCSISSAFFASFFSAPADYVMARYMSCNENKTVGDCIRIIYKEGGAMAFWKGWSVFFVRLTPVLMTYTSVYEQLRFHFGLGYLD